MMEKISDPKMYLQLKGMKKTNWAILGLGKIAKKFAADLITLPNANLYAVGSRTSKKAKAFAKEFGATKSYGSYEALLADPTIDVVYIATPLSLIHI